MIGLLRKDLYMTLAYFRVFLVLLGVFLAVGFLPAAHENTFFIIYPMIIGMMLPVSLISYDERFRWNRTCDAMPCSRAQVVSSKYLLTLISVLLIFGLTMLGQSIRLGQAGRIDELARLVPLLLLLGFVGPSLLLPIIFWLGAERGRLAYFVAVGVVVAAGVFLSTGADSPLAFGGASLSIPVAVFACLGLFALSWLLSVRLYQKREL
ncbi:MAG: ABC-2 transporter permease [Oscillospiraceae bacterium]|nr:ABC-2 transporter permease [Oscillospiraceae bacterium]